MRWAITHFGTHTHTHTHTHTPDALIKLIRFRTCFEDLTKRAPVRYEFMHTHSEHYRDPTGTPVPPQYGALD